MKKITALVLIGIVLFTGTYFVLNQQPNNETDVVFVEITTTELVELITAKTAFSVYLYKETCSACQTFSPILEQNLQATSLQVYKVEIVTSDDLQLALSAFADAFQYAFPAFYSVKNGVVVDYFVGGIAEENLARYLEQNKSLIHT